MPFDVTPLHTHIANAQTTALGWRYMLVKTMAEDCGCIECACDIAVCKDNYVRAMKKINRILAAHN